MIQALLRDDNYDYDGDDDDPAAGARCDPIDGAVVGLVCSVCLVIWYVGLVVDWSCCLLVCLS